MSSARQQHAAPPGPLLRLPVVADELVHHAGGLFGGAHGDAAHGHVRQVVRPRDAHEPLVPGAALLLVRRDPVADAGPQVVPVVEVAVSEEDDESGGGTGLLEGVAEEVAQRRRVQESAREGIVDLRRGDHLGGEGRSVAVVGGAPRRQAPGLGRQAGVGDDDVAGAGEPVEQPVRLSPLDRQGTADPARLGHGVEGPGTGAVGEGDAAVGGRVLRPRHLAQAAGLDGEDAGGLPEAGGAVGGGAPGGGQEQLPALGVSPAPVLQLEPVDLDPPAPDVTEPQLVEALHRLAGPHLRHEAALRVHSQVAGPAPVEMEPEGFPRLGLGDRTQADEDPRPRRRRRQHGGEDLLGPARHPQPVPLGAAPDPLRRGMEGEAFVLEADPLQKAVDGPGGVGGGFLPGPVAQGALRVVDHQPVRVLRRVGIVQPGALFPAPVPAGGGLAVEQQLVPGVEGSVSPVVDDHGHRLEGMDPTGMVRIEGAAAAVEQGQAGTRRALRALQVPARDAVETGGPDGDLVRGPGGGEAGGPGRRRRPPRQAPPAGLLVVEDGPGVEGLVLLSGAGEPPPLTTVEDQLGHHATDRPVRQAPREPDARHLLPPEASDVQKLDGRRRGPSVRGGPFLADPPARAFLDIHQAQGQLGAGGDPHQNGLGRPTGVGEALLQAHAGLVAAGRTDLGRRRRGRQQQQGQGPLTHRGSPPACPAPPVRRRPGRARSSRLPAPPPSRRRSSRPRGRSPPGPPPGCGPGGPRR